MKILLVCLLCAVCAPAQVRYNSSNQMLKPDNYREWIYLSSGVGMSYLPPVAGKEVAGKENAAPPFDNVFVNPEAYRSFVKTGAWPDRTVFVLEVRTSVEKNSI